MESGAPNEKKISKILEILFLFQSFLNASLCNLIQINFFALFSSKFRPQKIFTKQNLTRRISELLTALRKC